MPPRVGGISDTVRHQFIWGEGLLHVTCLSIVRCILISHYHVLKWAFQNPWKLPSPTLICDGPSFLALPMAFCACYQNRLLLRSRSSDRSQWAGLEEGERPGSESGWQIQVDHRQPGLGEGQDRVSHTAFPPA